jgi:ribose-phosphate pyrophosphokinase
MAAGATTVDAIVIHALFPPELLGEFRHAGIRSIHSTDSVPHPTNAIALDGVLATALRNEIGSTDPAENVS